MMEIEKVLERGYGEARVRVRYAETDQMGVVYHANYLVWFEVGRVEFMRQLGLEYRQLEAEGAMIPVLEVTARYLAPAKYDDELLVKTTMAGVRGSILRFRYAVVRIADEQLLCEGESVHMVVDRDMKRRAIPEPYAGRFATLMERTKAAKDK
jgi:acyl-CoA thioester hydrolase